MEKKICNRHFITFEGPEGGGKSTQINKLAEYLESKGHTVIVTREPGGTKLGGELRGMILNPYNTVIGDRTELLLFQADRAQHIKEIIIPALEKGFFVLCDRFTDSTIAYQVGGRGFPRETINYLNEFSAYGLTPELTILLDVDYAVGIKRATKIATDRFENESAVFHSIIRAKYLEIQKAEPERVKLINTTQNSVEVITEQIIKVVNDKYGF
ncbi:MAG: dTMP kinase [Candidatus Margulisbacteria bacterium]|nr:dTMP kinase [Candidatus Margulisiibacteriota bacterium]